MVVEVEGEAMVEVDLVEADSSAEEDLGAMVAVEEVSEVMGVVEDSEVMEVAEEDMAEVVEDSGEVLAEDLAEEDLAEGADMEEATADKVRKCHQSWSEAGGVMGFHGGVERQHNCYTSQISHCSLISTHTVLHSLVLDDVSMIIYIYNDGITFFLPHISERMFVCFDVLSA